MNKEGYSYKLFLKRLVKYFTFPFLLLLIMNLFSNNVLAMMVIFCLIVLYFFAIILRWIVRFFVFIFHIKEIKIFKEEKTLVFQLFAVVDH